MKFSGHETFPVREGWLHKGLRLVDEQPEQLENEEVADVLGVGRNMAKSIRHWLLTTKLATDTAAGQRGKNTILHLTELGQLVREHDPYLLSSGTWWILHANLVNNFKSATTWSWFFNNFSHDRFDRSVCLEALRRYIEASQKKVPSAATLGRDLGCMLLSYARTIPAVLEDPEDGSDCPFRFLGLMKYYRTSGYYRVDRSVKKVSPWVFGYVMSLVFPTSSFTTVTADIKLTDAARKPGGPGRVFCLTGETLFETVSLLEAESNSQISIGGLAGDRTVKMPCMAPDEWARMHFETIEEAGHV